MDIYGFAVALARRIEREVPHADLKNEGEFERKHVVEPAWQLSLKYPEIRVFAHPENRKLKCRDGCNAGAVDPLRRVQGCPDCWKTSKKWSVVDVYGTRNNFDLVASDREKKSLAVEVKWLRFLAGKGPNSEFQRFIGQCTLAAAVENPEISETRANQSSSQLCDGQESSSWFPILGGFLAKVKGQCNSECNRDS